jgi:hypothetical protein
LVCGHFASRPRSAKMRKKRWLRSPAYAYCVQERHRNVEVIMAVQGSFGCACK